MNFVNDSTGYTDSDGLEIGVDENGYAYISHQEALDIGLFIGGEHKGYLASDGVLHLGGGTDNGRLELHPSSSQMAHVAATAGSNGGELYVNDETGAIHTSIQPDVDGTGGFFEVANGLGGSVLYVDGNHFGGGDGAVVIHGSGSSTTFDTAESGDDAVVLPADAISSSEILDEPGSTGVARLYSQSLSGGVEELASVTIAAPASGRVTVSATAWAQADRVSGSATADFGISLSDDTLAGPSRIRCGESDGSETGTSFHPISLHYTYYVSGTGQFTFYLVGEPLTGNWTVEDAILSLMYLPTSYSTAASQETEPSSAWGMAIPAAAEGTSRAAGPHGRAQSEAAGNTP